MSLFDATRDTDRETTQFEARLASNSDGPLNYVVGAFQQTNDAKFCVVQLLGFIDLALPFASLGLPAQFNNNAPQVLCNQQDSDSLAGYVDAIGFIASGGLFISFMSGNSTRLGIGLAQASQFAALAGSLLAAFVAGVTLATLIGRRLDGKRRRGQLLLVAAQ